MTPVAGTELAGPAGAETWRVPARPFRHPVQGHFSQQRLLLYPVELVKAGEVLLLGREQRRADSPPAQTPTGK